MKKQNRNLFRITRLILLKLPFVFRFFAKFRKPAKRLLIIKTDAIGDYILFRNFLEILRRSEKFKDHRVTLLGNELWRDIALKYDGAFGDDFLFTRPEQLYSSPLQTLKLSWRLFKNNYNVVLQPSFTRLLITDGLAANTAARQIIGFETNNEGLPERYKIKTDKFYTLKLTIPKDAYFEFERSKFFFEKVLGAALQIRQPYLPVNNTGGKDIVIFPGAGVLKRGWEPEKFLELIKLIRQQSSAKIYIAGGNSELQTGKYLVENLPPGGVENLIAKTSLTELIGLIGKAALVISNETSAIHIAAATQTKAICILGGGHFGRFAPYPGYMESAPLCLYEKMDCYFCNWNCIYQTAQNERFPCISAVSLEKVWEATLPFL